jgi:uncharacterized protein (DUF2225 family)
MKEVIECPFCNCKIRRQGSTTTIMASRLASHITHYHVMGLSEE